jgi:trans-2,3-dihydro-3-hydroxyanthranilate isomerase
MSRRPFTTLDVFTERRFTGNPLAVVHDGAGLDTGVMQAVAREFNLPETVFVLPPNEPGHRARVRIFTPARELPFAGHPTVGTAVVLALRDGLAEGEIVLEQGIGPVRCRVDGCRRDHGHAGFELARLPEAVGPEPDRNTLAAALGLAPGDIGYAGFSPAIWSAGNPFLFVPVNGLAAIARARPDMAHWDAAAAGAIGVFLFCGETADRRHAFRARMFAPQSGITEDPATGSAAAAFAGLLARDAGLPDGSHQFGIEQGYEMGRPSLISLAFTSRGGAVAQASIAGHAVVASEGTIEA